MVSFLVKCLHFITKYIVYYKKRGDSDTFDSERLISNKAIS